MKFYQKAMTSLLAFSLLAQPVYANLVFIAPPSTSSAVDIASELMPLFPDEDLDVAIVLTPPVPETAPAPASTSAVQLLHWNDVRELLDYQMVISVFDVLSGITYEMIHFSAGSHSDVRPASHADTALIHQTFNHRWDWDVRPVWVTINGVTVAASINGQPHGSTAMYHTNGMAGHVCLHFLGSNVHNGNAAFARLHQEVLMEAYRMSH